MHTTLQTATKKNRAAVALGRKGGRVRSDAKAAASRANGAKGGRPRKLPALSRTPLCAFRDPAKRGSRSPACSEPYATHVVADYFIDPVTRHTSPLYLCTAHAYHHAHLAPVAITKKAAR